MVCTWFLKSPLRTDYYIEGVSEWSLILEFTFNAHVFIFKGSSLEDATSLIEGGDQWYPGNPIRLTAPTDDLVIVFKRPYISGAAHFSATYKVKGRTYPFWEEPFIEEDEIYWHLFRVGLLIFALFMLWLPLYTFCWRPCIRQKPICCCCGS